MKKGTFQFLFLVGIEGLEPTHLTASDPKSDVSTKFHHIPIYNASWEERDSNSQSHREWIYSPRGYQLPVTLPIINLTIQMDSNHHIIIHMSYYYDRHPRVSTHYFPNNICVYRFRQIPKGYCVY